MTRRGRWTLGVALVLGALAWWIALAPRGEPAPEEATGAAPSVAAPPPDRVVPLSLLARPPVERGVVERGDVLRRRIALSAPPPPELAGVPGPLRIETTLDAELTREIWRILERGRVELGHVLVFDPRDGELWAYVSTDPERFPPTRLYPAASLIKVVTTAAALDVSPGVRRRKCHYVGNQYRLTRRRVDPPRGGNAVTMRKALATSNNQCFAQLAVHTLGSNALLEAIDRFGLLHAPAPGHAAGEVHDPGGDPYALGQLGSGLDGTWITPLHAAQLAGVLADGRRFAPRWVDRVVDADGHALELPPSPPPERVLTAELAHELRDMLVETTRRGTARRAFRTRSGRPLLQGVQVAGKTGSLSGHDPDGRYEWFAGIAPASDPRVAVAVVTVHGALFWVSSSQVAAEVFKVLFCPDGICKDDAVSRWRGEGAMGPAAEPGSAAGAPPPPTPSAG